MTLADRQPGRGGGNGLSDRLVAWLTTLGPLAVDRPAPSLGQTTAGVGGALVAGAVVVLGGDRWASSGEEALGIVLTVGLLAASVAAMTRTQPPLTTAAVAASGVAAPAAGFFLAAMGDGLPSLREVAVLAGVMLGCLYAVGPWRGHTFHLALLATAAWVLALTLGGLGITQSGGFSTVGDTITGGGAASMAVGVVYLGLGSWLHDEGLRGVATPFLGVAVLALPIGAFVVVRDTNAVLQGLVLMASGAVIAFVGGRCRRRGLIWIGVGVVALGVVLVPGGVTDSTAAGAVLVTVLGAALVAVAPRLAALVGEGTNEPMAAAVPPESGDDPWAPPYFDAEDTDE